MKAPLRQQGNFLRIPQESEVMRIVSDRVIPMEVRIDCRMTMR